MLLFVEYIESQLDEQHLYVTPNTINITYTTCSSVVVNTKENTNYKFDLNEQVLNLEDYLGYLSRRLDDIVENTWTQ